MVGDSGLVSVRHVECPGHAVGDCDPCSVEPGQDESLEPFVVCPAVVGQQANRRCFADPQSANAVGAEMHAGRVTGESDIGRALVDLTT